MLYCKISKNKYSLKEPWYSCGSFLCSKAISIKSEKGCGNVGEFKYKQQFAVVVICKDEKEQESIYNRLKEEGFKLKVVAV